MYAYSNNGFSMRSVDDDYVAQTGEVLFPDHATISELNLAFPLYNSGVPILTKAQKIAALNAEYDVRFQALQRAYASAGLANNGALTIAQKQDSLTQQNLALLAEKTAKLEAIKNG